MSEEMNLEDQLALTLDSMMTTQEALTREREEWAKERAQFLQEMEQERVELAKTRGELVQAIQGAALQSVGGLVATAAESLTKQVEEKLRARLDSKLTQAEVNLSTATARGKEISDRLVLLAKDLKGNWKTSLERTFIQVLPTALVLVAVGGFISLWLRSDADTAKQRMLEWTSTHTKTVQEHKQMNAEMEAWKQAGIDEVELVPCAAPPGGLCVRVDKKRGALGPNKDLFVPAQR